MRFSSTSLPGVLLLELELAQDDRGWFARATDQQRLDQAGLDARVAQTSLSYSARRGTLRGLHWQAAPHGEVKIVRVLQGAVHDVVVDMRPDSPTYLRHQAVHLTGPQRALYIPAGFAHGFQTLTDKTMLHYQMSVPHVPEAARGARFDDPALGIHWPLPRPQLSPRDRSWPLLAREVAHAA